MMKGISFDEIHSYDDLNLVLSSVNIPPATPKENFIDIPGGDGSVDLTEALGEVKFNDRAGTFTFTVLPQDDFEEKKRQVSNLLNGRRFNRIIVDKDPNFFWTGRCKVNDYASDKNIHQIVVGAVLAPYKLKTKQTDVVASAGNGTAVVLRNGRKSAVPTITCTKEATVVFEGNTYRVNAGTHTLLNIVLKQGDNRVTVTSGEAVKFTYQEGDL